MSVIRSSQCQCTGQVGIRYRREVCSLVPESALWPSRKVSGPRLPRFASSPHSPCRIFASLRGAGAIAASSTEKRVRVSDEPAEGGPGSRLRGVPRRIGHCDGIDGAVPVASGGVHHHVRGSVMPTVTIEADRSIFYETSGGALSSWSSSTASGIRVILGTGPQPAPPRPIYVVAPRPSRDRPQLHPANVGWVHDRPLPRKRPPVLPGAETDRYGAGRAQPRRRNRTAGCAAASAGVQRPGARRAYSGCGHQQLREPRAAGVGHLSNRRPAGHLRGGGLPPPA